MDPSDFKPDLLHYLDISSPQALLRCLSVHITLMVPWQFVNGQVWCGGAGLIGYGAHLKSYWFADSLAPSCKSLKTDPLRKGCFIPIVVRWHPLWSPISVTEWAAYFLYLSHRLALAEYGLS